MKVLFINPPWYRLQGLEFIGVPIGITYLAAVLEKNGHNAKVWNADFKNGTRPQFASSSVYGVEDMSKHYEDYLKKLNDLDSPIWQEVRNMIKKEDPDVIGVTCYTSTYKSALNVTKIAKDLNPNIKTILGGPHPTIMPDETVKNETVDFVVKGEAEETILELVQEIEKTRTPKNVKGVLFKENGHVKHNPPRPLIENLDTLPIPARHLIIDKEKYPPSVFGVFYASRGCPFQCIYCGSHNIWGRKTRFASPEYIVNEIKTIKDEFGAYKYSFCDDTFPLNPKHANRVFELILKEKLDIIWNCETRANILNDGLVRNMKKAGCHSVGIGVESGDPETLKMMKKGVTVEDMKNAARLLKKHKINLVTFFMVGFPWETKEQIENTIRLLKELNPGMATCNVVTPAPGTELFDMVQEKGLIPKKLNWHTFYHQSPEMFITPNFTREEISKIIERAQRIFDHHNKKRSRERVFEEMDMIVKRIYKERLYKKPSLLFNLFTNIF
ncbi:MAG: radical SAM protein [Candidatus Aenigmarchaeota archaeon]|nr:radical SAM protein [Candidatus Aenigmarchaeota archaeon]